MAGRVNEKSGWFNEGQGSPKNNASAGFIYKQ
jgi:hypothetical protein